jgi:hypothetical protein
MKIFAKSRLQRACIGLGATFFIAISLVLPGLSPFLGIAHAEAPTQVQIPLGGNRYLNLDYTLKEGSTPDNEYFGLASCVGHLTTVGLTDDNMQRVMHSTGIHSSTEKFGPANATPAIKEQYTRFLKANKDNNVSAIEFGEAPTRATGSTQNCDGKFMLFPVESFAGPNDTNPDNPKVWVGWHHHIGYRTTGEFMIRFTAYGPTSDGKSTAGTFEFFDVGVTRIDGRDQRTLNGKQQTNVVIEGVAKPSAPVTSGNYSSARFIDAHEIEVKGKVNGNEVTETYIDPKWDNKMYYFLASTSDNARTQIAGKASPDTDPIASPSNNKTPFIALSGPGINLEFNGSTVSAFQNGISQLGAGDIKLYDYDVTGVPVGNASNGLPQPSSLNGLTDRARASVWFYYSTSTKAATTVFRSAGGNESNYSGSYALPTSGSNGELLHASTNCDSLGSLKIDSSAASSTGIVRGDWTLRQPNQGCASGNGFGTVTVQVISNEEKYNEIVTGSPSEATLPSNNRVGRLICDVTILNPITWLMCPIATAATSAVDQLDSAINDMLNVNGDQYFGDTDTGRTLYTVWQNLRTLAMGVIVIVALFMVIAQASGWEILSALVFRKMLTNFVFTIILLALWWPIGRAVIQLGDVATFGIRSFIYAPFGGSGAIHLDPTTSSVLALLGTGTILALGIFATLTFAVSAFLAIALGYAVLLIRLMVVIGGHTLSAIFIPFKAIPNSKVFSFFWGTFWKAVALGPILAGAIAFARVMSKILYSAANGRLSFHIAAMVVYFGIYGALIEIVNAMGGFIATLTGRARGVFGGLQNGMRNVRGKAPGNRYKRFKHGEFFDDTFLTNANRRGPLGALGSFGNRMGERVGLGMRNRFGFGETGRRAAAFHEDSQIDDRLRSNGALRSLGLNEDLGNAVLATSGGTKAGAQRAMDRISAGRRAAGQAALTTAERADVMSAITPLLSRKNAMAAGRNMMQNKARGIATGDIATLDAGLNELSEGNEYMAQMFKSSLAYFGRSSGRVDLGGEWTQFRRGGQLQGVAAAMRNANPAMTEQEAVSHATMLDAIGRTDTGAVLRAHPATVNQMANTIEYVLKNVSPAMVDAQGNNIGRGLRQEAAMRALELQKGVANGMASGDVQRVINDLMVNPGRLGMSYSGQMGTVADQLAAWSTSGRPYAGDTDALSGAELSAMARIYDQEIPTGALPGQQPPPP